MEKHNPNFPRKVPPINECPRCTSCRKHYFPPIANRTTCGLCAKLAKRRNLLQLQTVH